MSGGEEKLTDSHRVVRKTRPRRFYLAGDDDSNLSYGELWLKAGRFSEKYVTLLIFDDWRWFLQHRIGSLRGEVKELREIQPQCAVDWIASNFRPPKLPKELQFCRQIGVPQHVFCPEHNNLFLFDPRNGWKLRAVARNGYFREEYLFSGSSEFLGVTRRDATHGPTVRSLAPPEVIDWYRTQKRKPPSDIWSRLSVIHALTPDLAKELTASQARKLKKVVTDATHDCESTPSSADSETRPTAGDSDSPQDTPSDLVRLSQVAPLVGREKRTLEGWQQKDQDFPLPVIQGTGGMPSLWSWNDLRPYLEQKVGTKLRERHPAHGVD